LPTDDITGQIVDGNDNVAYFTAKGSGGFTNLSVSFAGPVQGVAPGTPTVFPITVSEFASLDEPFFTMDFGDGQSASGPVPSATFDIIHTYQPGTSFPTTATLKVMDAGGRLGSDTVELHACAAVPPAGFDCTPLLNKGTGVVVGELYFRRQGTDVALVTDLFGSLLDSGHSGVKLCVDDDLIPFNVQTSCLGNTTASKVTSCGALPDANAAESDGSLWEVMIEGTPLSETTQVVGSRTLARYDVCVDGYRFFSFHFNQTLSIQAFFEAPP